MAKKVIGVFATEEEAEETIQNLESQGYKPEDLTILTDRGNAESLENESDVRLETGVSRNKQDESFMDKIKRAFMQDVGPEEKLSTKERLGSHGLPEEQIPRYAKELESGNFLLLSDENSGGRVAPIADDNLDSLDRTGRTNVATDDLASTSKNQNIIADDQEPTKSDKASKDTDQTRNDTSQREDKTLEENPVLNKSNQQRKGRSF